MNITVHVFNPDFSKREVLKFPVDKQKMSFDLWPKYDIHYIGFTTNCITVFLKDKSD